MAVNTSQSAHLSQLASNFGLRVESRDFAVALDNRDPLREFRAEFHYPKMKDLPDTTDKTEEDCIYLCGHSLGLMPRRARENINTVLDMWAQMGVEHHTNGYLKAAYCELYPKEMLSKLVGCLPHEVVVMNGLTVNLHLLMLNFYKPTDNRFKIVIEEAAFPSDMYAVKSQLTLHNRTLEEGLIALTPRQGEDVLREDDILQLLRDQGPSISMVVLPGVQYLSGQSFDVKKITDAGHGQGCVMLWDMAHSVGNVPVRLHDWGVDCAVWCSYKYLNSGAGGAGGAFVHEKHLNKLPACHGWWGNDTNNKFEMLRTFTPVPFSADQYKLSNAPPLLIAPLMTSLEIFDRSGEQRRLEKQKLLTGYLEQMLVGVIGGGVPLTIITPRDPDKRGSMLCVKVNSAPETLADDLAKRGVVCDVRKPDVIRIGPMPLYNSFEDIWRFIDILRKILI